MKWIKENAGFFSFGIFFISLISYGEFRVSNIKNEIKSEIVEIKTEVKDIKLDIKDINKRIDDIDKKLDDFSTFKKRLKQAAK